MTAKEFINRIDNEWSYWSEDIDSIEAALKEFAEIHVKLALESASKAARIIDDPDSYAGNTGSEYPPDQIVDKESILNAYPKENIQ